MSADQQRLPSVLHLSHLDEYGGAGRSAYRLHDGLRRLGVRSRMIVGVKSRSDPDIAEHSPSFADRVVGRLAYETGLQYPYVPSSRRLLRHPWVQSADVVQLANVHGGWLALSTLPRLARGRRLVWCLHDMWAFTGHCGYSYGHDGWLTGCGGCPHLDAYPPVRRDATRVNVRLKRATYARLKMDVVAPSKWLAGLAGRSPLLAGFPVHVIPYGIDTSFFAPLDQAQSRASFGLPEDEAIVLVAGLEPRKGSDLLGPMLAAAEQILARPVTLAVAGAPTNSSPPAGFTVRMLGNLDEEAMRRAYSASDLYVLPTLWDNLPNTVLEALACGVPVIGTRVGGIPDAIEDGVNGLLSEPDGAELGAAVGRILGDAELARRLGAAGRETAVRRFALETQARAYLELYAS